MIHITSQCMVTTLDVPFHSMLNTYYLRMYMFCIILFYFIERQKILLEVIAFIVMVVIR